jgi:hypothetical protein
MHLEAPRTLDDFTPEWMSELLGARVTGVRSEHIAVGEGFTSVLARLNLTYDGDVGDGPQTVIAKLPSEEPGAVALGQLLKLWEREARFYSDVAPTLPVRTAHVYFSGGDEESGLFTVVMEDLSRYRVGNQVAGATKEDAEAAIDWLAPFHARWWGKDDLGAFGWLPHVKTDPMFQGLQPMLEGVWPAYIEKFQDLVPEQALQWVEQSKSRLTELLIDDPVTPTIIHSDYRLDNLFFTGEEVIPVDWQAPAVGQALYDVAYFLQTCVDPELRRTIERGILERWSAGLAAAGVKAPSGDELWEEYRRMTLVVMLVSALLFGQLDFTVNERAGELARACALRVMTAGVDLGAGEFV